MRLRLVLYAAALVLSQLPHASAAQLPSTPGDSARSARRPCFHPQPLATCRSFLITEAGAATTSSAGDDGPEAHVIWELGLMRNRSANTAVGGSAMLALSDDFARFAFKMRYRRWLGRTASIDLAPGIVLAGSNQDLDLRPMLGVTGHAGLNIGDVIGGFVQVEVANQPGAGVEPRLYVGARAGGVLGLIGGIAGPVIFVLGTAESH